MQSITAFTFDQKKHENTTNLLMLKNGRELQLLFPTLDRNWFFSIKIQSAINQTFFR